MFKNLGKISLLIVTFSLAVLCLSVFLIFNVEKYLQTAENNSPPIGKVSIFSGEVKRKFNGHIQWNNLTQEVKIFEGDSLFTGNESTVTVVLDDNQQTLTIAQNSLVTFSRLKDELLLDVNFGNFDTAIKSTSKIKFKRRNKIIKIKSKKETVMKLTVSKYKPLKINLIKGESEVNTNSGQVNLLKNQTYSLLEIESQKPSTISTSNLIPLEEPLEPATITAPPPMVIDSEEEKQEEKRDPAADSKLANKPKAKKFGTVKHGENKKFILFNKMSLSGNASEQYKPSALKWDYSIKENNNDSQYHESVNYKLRIKDNKNKTVQTLKTNRNSYFLKELPHGEYSLSITPYDKKTGHSSKKPFTKKFSISLSPPKITSPSSFLDKVTDISLLKSSPPAIDLTWTPTPHTSSYLIHISDSQSFKKYKSFKTDQSKFSYLSKNFGTYYWKVKSLNSDESPISTFSTSQKITTKRKYYNLEKSKNFIGIFPENKNSIVLVGTGSDNIQFIWSKPYEKKTTYVIEITNDKKFNKILFSHKSTKNRFILKENLPKGWLYWRVKAYWGEIQMGVTKTNSFKILQEQGL